MLGPSTQLPTPGAVLDYWIGPAGHDHLAADRLQKRWFIKRADTDAFIEKQFGALLQILAAGLALDWAAAGPCPRLAAIIVLDQFGRNMFRGSPASFQYDPLALHLSLEGIERGEHASLTEVEQSFFFLPLEHSETLVHQDSCVDQFETLAREARPAFRPLCERSLDYAHQHRDIIRKFGRFPHRNAILGRENTPEETSFLSKPGAGF